MDNWKKYIKDNEEKLSIEDVDDKVWQNVYKTAVPKGRSIFNQIKNSFYHLFQKHPVKKEGLTGNRRNSKFRLAYALVFIAFLTASFAFKVKSHSKYGDVVTFEIPKKTYLLNNETYSKSLFNSFYRITSPLDSSSFLFIRCIKESKQDVKTIVHQLKAEEGVSDLVITPVVFEFKESLFSSFFNKAFKIQINERKPDIKQIKNKITSVLKEKGLNSVIIQIDDNNKDLVFSSQNIEQERLLPGIKDSIVTEIDITNKIKVVDKKVVTNHIKIAENDSAQKKTKDLQQSHDLNNFKFDGVKYQESLKKMNQFLDALHKDGLIDKKKPYIIEVKAGELYINSIKQPKEVTDKFKKYFQSDNYALMND